MEEKVPSQRLIRMMQQCKQREALCEPFTHRTIEKAIGDLYYPTLSVDQALWHAIETYTEALTFPQLGLSNVRIMHEIVKAACHPEGVYNFQQTKQSYTPDECKSSVISSICCEIMMTDVTYFRSKGWYK